jgi:predicted flap endonuclease-1-like 5' DNA nuclease
MTDPAIVGGAVAALGIAAAAAYSYLTGNESSAGVDFDNDGEDEADFEFGGSDDPENPVNADVDEQSDPTPEAVTEKDGLEAIKGIGETRAATLENDGFETPEDIYYASDDNLLDVTGLGPRAVEYIRDDIGGIDHEGNSGESSDEETVESSDSNTTESSEEADSDPESDGSDSEDEETGTGSESNSSE